MKATLLAILAKAKSLASAALAWSPLVCGICIGYFGSSIIALAIKLVADLAKAVLG